MLAGFSHLLLDWNANIEAYGGPYNCSVCCCDYKLVILGIPKWYCWSLFRPLYCLSCLRFTGYLSRKHFVAWIAHQKGPERERIALLAAPLFHPGP